MNVSNDLALGNIWHDPHATEELLQVARWLAASGLPAAGDLQAGFAIMEGAARSSHQPVAAT